MNVLAIGAHPDDVELGCGATLAAHRARGDSIALLVMTPGEHGPQAAISRVSEQEEAAKILGARLYWGPFQDGAVPEGREAVDLIQSVIEEVGADVIYTHASHDSHQDHRATAASSLAAARRATRLITYEAPTSLGFVPSLFVDVEGFVERKLAAIRAHESQVEKNRLVDLEAVAAQARWRGFQARLHYAEGFVAERFSWDLFADASLIEPADPVLLAVAGAVG
jgi:LmbE family N-acetylglucosaminyl deacetylase